MTMIRSNPPTLPRIGPSNLFEDALPASLPLSVALPAPSSYAAEPAAPTPAFVVLPAVVFAGSNIGSVVGSVWAETFLEATGVVVVGVAVSVVVVVAVDIVVVVVEEVLVHVSALSIGSDGNVDGLGHRVAYSIVGTSSNQLLPKSTVS